MRIKTAMALAAGLALLCAQPAPALEKTPGKIWNRLTDTERFIYLWGYRDCAMAKRDEAVALFLREKRDIRNPIWKGFMRSPFASFGIEQIRDVMTSLYKDPANTFIKFEMMVSIARLELEGRLTETRLNRFRQIAHEMRELDREVSTKGMNNARANRFYQVVDEMWSLVHDELIYLGPLKK